MKRSNLARSLRVVFILAVLAAAVSTYDSLPDMVPTHWNVHGVADNFTTKGKGAFMMPGIAVLIALMLPFFAYIDPRRKNYDKFRKEWEAIQTTIVGFFTYFYFTQLYVILNHIEGQVVSSLYIGGISVMFIILGQLIRRIKSNFFVGIRTPWTIEDPVVWEKTHEMGGKTFILIGLLFLPIALRPEYFTGLLFVGIILLVLIPVVYSYFLYRKRHPL